MSTDPTRRWLESRLRATPPELATDMERLLASVPESLLDDPPRALAAAALAGLDEVAEGEGERADALRLLAADAALTWAFEAATETGRVVELARTVGLEGELGRRLASGSVGVTGPEGEP